MSTAAIYIRVSTEDQAGPTAATLDTQLLRCREYAERHRWTVVNVYEDQDSAFKLNGDRPGFERMIADAKAGRFKHIIVLRLDRFGRRAYRTMALIEELKEDYGVEVHSYLENLDDWFVANIDALLAEKESRNISARVKLATMHRAQHGYWPGRLGFGMKRTPEGVLQWDGVESAIILEAFERVAAGESIRRIKGWLEEATPGRRWPLAYVAAMLRNPVYTGKLPWAGKVYEGKHEALVHPDLFAQVQQVLSRRYQHKVPAKGEYAVWGLAYCGKCQRKLNIHRESTARSRNYFRCYNRKTKHPLSPFVCSLHVRADRLESWFLEQISQFTFDPDAKAAFIARVKDRLEGLTASQQAKRMQLDQRIRRLRHRLDRLLEGRLDGTIPAEEYLLFQPRWSADLRQAEAELDLLNTEIPAIDVSAVEQALDKLPLVILNAKPETVREYALLFIDKVYCYGKTADTWQIAWRYAGD